jgi:hypothetical protein
MQSHHTFSKAAQFSGLWANSCVFFDMAFKSMMADAGKPG